MVTLNQFLINDIIVRICFSALALLHVLSTKTSDIFPRGQLYRCFIPILYLEYLEFIFICMTTIVSVYALINSCIYLEYIF